MYEELKRKKTIVHSCWSLYVILHPFVPWSTFLFFPRFPFACELGIERWRIEVVEAQVGYSVSPVGIERWRIEVVEAEVPSEVVSIL